MCTHQGPMEGTQDSKTTRAKHAGSFMLNGGDGVLSGYLSRYVFVHSFAIESLCLLVVSRMLTIFKYPCVSILSSENRREMEKVIFSCQGLDFRVSRRIRSARSRHSLWGNGSKRPQESTKTRTKLMLEGIGDAYRLLAGSDAVCKGRCVPMQKRRIGCTNRQCQKLCEARSELVWCQNAT